MQNETNLTTGPIFKTLIRFSLPVILSIFLQSLYGAVDLFVVGRFASTSDVSGVSTGSQLMQSLTFVIVGLSMGVTVIVGNKIGENRKEEASRAIGCAICFFLTLSFILTCIFVPCAPLLASLLNAPSEAFSNTTGYIRICSIGLIFITAYNLIGSIFRGIGDSKTPLLTVAISCFFNIVGDYLFVAVFNMGARGAALATIVSQGLSVFISYIFIKKMDLPIEFSKADIRFDTKLIKKEISIGFPIALQDLLVSVSFLIILTVVNSISLVASAGVGVAEKVCAFIMLVPSAFSQSVTAFVAQNYGAMNHQRSRTALKYGILLSVGIGIVMFYISFFYGNVLASIFDSDSQVILQAHSYLKAYAIDCMFTPVMFCLVGYFNGYGRTKFVMLQGVLSAFCVRVPLAIIFGRMENTSLFKIGLGTPCATFTQIIACLIMFRHMNKELQQNCNNF